jgi:hypothetical protein
MTVASRDKERYLIPSSWRYSCSQFGLQTSLSLAP